MSVGAMRDDAKALLEVAEAANQIDWEYKPAVWGEYGEPPTTYHKVTAQIPEIRFPDSEIVFPSVEFPLTMPTIDIADGMHIATFDPPMMQRLLNRLIDAEATVERVETLCEELGEASGFDFTPHDREVEYPISYFQEALRTALDEE